MKKLLSLNMAFILLCLCGCADRADSNKTRFLLDTLVQLDVSCDDEVLEEAFELCAEYEKRFSRTDKNSDVYKINHAEIGDRTEVSEDTAALIERALYYCHLSGGRFDITIAPVSGLWDFKRDVVPSRDEIAEALKNVDYQSVLVEDNFVGSVINDIELDLGGIAKGYIADKLKIFFDSKGASEGIINLGGNVVVFGDEEKIVGIKDPENNDKLAARVAVKNMSVVTAGTYERFIEKDGKKYHHILDPETGYGVETDLLSATVIGKDSADCDALSTICILLGYENAYPLIEMQEGIEAVFVKEGGKVLYTSGLEKKDDLFRLK